MSKTQPKKAPRRNSYVNHEVVYAAVGASSAPDLMRFPPEGANPYESELRLGSGQERFLVASSALMTWGAQRGVGITVTDIQVGDGGEYAGVMFDADGGAQPATDDDVRYSPEGEPFLTAGTVVTLGWEDGRQPRRVRVVYTLNETNRVGYAWGSTDTLGVIGEERFTVEQRADGTVWATVRGFLWPTEDGIFGLKGKSAMKVVIEEAHKQLGSLVPGVLGNGH